MATIQGEGKETEAKKITPEGVSAEDRARVERLARKLAIIDEMAIISSRIASFEELHEQKRGELRLLMAEDGDVRLVTERGTASVADSDRRFTVTDPRALLDLFPNKTLEEKALFLAQNFKPSVAFVDSATELGLNVQKAVANANAGKSTLEVARARGAAAKAEHQRIMESTRHEYEFNKKQAAADILAGSNQKGAKA